MHTETPNRRAFEAVASARDYVEKFQKKYDYSLLETADELIQQAIKFDPDYINAYYYAGIIGDLSGRPADAVPHFRKIVNEVEDPKIRLESLYNLGVAYYHQYHKEELAEAKILFKELIDSSTDNDLKLLARANLAQAHAMSMHPSSKERDLLRKEDTAGPVFNSIRLEFDAALKHAKAVLEYGKNRRALSSTDVRNKVLATAHNALGMAQMYFTDRLARTEAETLKHLESAGKDLMAAQRALRHDWANTCDLASLHLRLHVAAKSESDGEKHFAMSRQLLNNVLSELRPDYGFAFYELGRLYRVSGQFNEAIRAFEKSLEIDEKYRDVSSKTVKEEIAKAEKQKSIFP